MLVTPPLAPIYSALDDALTTTLEALHLAADSAGLPNVRLATEVKLSRGELRTRLHVMACLPHREWNHPAFQVEGATLAEVEQKFYAQLNNWLASQQPDEDRAADAAIAYAKEQEAGL